MSGPTGYEVGGARQLTKLITYTNDGVPPGNYPSPENVFRETRATARIDTLGAPAFNVGYVTTDPVTGGNLLVIYPTWGAPGAVYPSPF